MNILPETLTEAQTDSVCMSIRHDFGIDKHDPIEGDFATTLGCGMTEADRFLLRAQVKEFYHAIRKEFEGITEDIMTIRALKLRNVTVKDIVVIYGETEYAPGKKHFNFAPHYIKPSGKIEFAYNHPKISYEEWKEFFPKGFCENQECVFEFDRHKGDILHALKLLDKCGIAHRRDDEFFENF